MSSAVRNSYDHRLRQAIVETGDPDLFPELRIPDSTRRTWMRRGVSTVVTFERADAHIIALQVHNAKLRKRVTTLVALVRLLITLVRVRDQSIEHTRVPTTAAKDRLLRAVTIAEPVLGRSAALKILGLSDGRLRSWKRRQTLCMLDDASPCPRTNPGRTEQPGPCRHSRHSSWAR